MRQVYFGREAAGEGAPAAEPLRPVPPPWPMPSGLTTTLVDRKTGKLASRWCAVEDQYLEYYIPGTEPTEYCDRTGGRRFRIPR
jgi:hypothetical protein